MGTALPEAGHVLGVPEDARGPAADVLDVLLSCVRLHVGYGPRPLDGIDLRELRPSGDAPALAGAGGCSTRSAPGLLWCDPLV